MIKVRFAPSPTGFLHLGSARTALFNWLYARHQGGKFLLRIEDTDQVRSEKRFLEEILSDLKWLGLDWDGDFIYQSQRFEVYRKAANEILQQGKAYKEGEALIFKVEKSRIIEIEDMIHGKVSFNTDDIKDQVMIKSDGSPAYNFCCVVDDVELGITHIIRGDDHLSNTPKQVLFYEAMAKKLPQFAHIPLLMGPDGAKLSKRHGAVAVEEYKKEGYLPGALFNYLMLLGWSAKDNREIIPLDEAIKIFDIKDVGDVQARFDAQKLLWMNSEYIMRSDTKQLLSLIKDELSHSGLDLENIDDGYLQKALELYKVRIKTLKEFLPLTDYLFKDDYTWDEKGKKKYLRDEANKDNIMYFSDRLEKLEDFSHEKIEDVCRRIAQERQLKASGIIHPTRVAISGKTKGAGLFEIMELLGKEKVIERIRKAATS